MNAGLLSAISTIAAIPKASDPGAAERGLEDWRRRAGAEAAAQVLDCEAGRALLAALFGNSPFLGQCALRHADLVAQALAEGPEAALDSIVAPLAGEVAAAAGDDRAAMHALRLRRQQAALTVAIADIAGVWDGRTATAGLTRFADAAIAAAVDHQLRRARAEGTLALADEHRPGEHSGLIVLGMGKLGGGELNYSSDIDLIVLFDAERAPYRGRDIQETFIRLTRRLSNLLEERTGDGFAFRTDLRLRPDPGATAPALSVAAAESYYASLGQNWERAAMIKARPVAGDVAAAEQFLRNLRPFMWRKHLDFAAIRDIHSIKRQIDVGRGRGTRSVRGHNVKLGRGGIRAIEFFTQTQQLIWGGRYPSLRVRQTERALQALCALERITREEADELAESYWYLRRVEHRLQMVQDQQTHTLPKDAEAFRRIAVFLGYGSPEAFEAELTSHLDRVAEHAGRLFSDAPALGAPLPGGGSLAFTSADDDPDTLDTLERMGFKNARGVSRAIRAWHHGRLRATRSQRARELLTELTPTLLAALARTANPDQAFARFDEFLANQPAGVQLFSLFQAAPKLLDLVAEIVGGAPRIADYLGRHAELFDAVLDPGFFGDLPGKAELEAALARELAAARDFEDRLDIARKWAADAKFQVSVQQLLGLRTAEDAAPALSDIADVLIQAMLAAVEDEFARRHGRVPGGGLAVLAYGKLGGRRLMRGSDLDLVFVYRAPPDGALSDGDKPLPATTYYARLCQRLVTAITVQTGAGLLYQVDLRLRPMGSEGPIASEVVGFERYLRDDAWTWEMLALTRARVVAGPESLRERLERVIRAALARPREPGKLAAEVLDMRLRMAREHRTDDPFAVKHVRGGIVDVEFIAQYLQLAHAAEHPEVLRTATIDALGALADNGLLAARTAEELMAAARLYYDVQAMQRLALSGRFDEAAAPEGVRRALSRAGGAADLADLKARLRRAQARVREHFEALIEAPAEAAAPADETPERERKVGP